MLLVLPCRATISGKASHSGEAPLTTHCGFCSARVQRVRPPCISSSTRISNRSHFKENQSPLFIVLVACYSNLPRSSSFVATLFQKISSSTILQRDGMNISLSATKEQEGEYSRS